MNLTPFLTISYSRDDHIAKGLGVCFRVLLWLCTKRDQASGDILTNKSDQS